MTIPKPTRTQRLGQMLMVARRHCRNVDPHSTTRYATQVVAGRWLRVSRPAVSRMEHGEAKPHVIIGAILEVRFQAMIRRDWDWNQGADRYLRLRDLAPMDDDAG